MAGREIRSLDVAMLRTFDALLCWPARAARDPGIRWLKDQILRITERAA